MDGMSDLEYLSPLIVLLTTATLLFDIISVSVMRNKVESITGGLVSISLGPCVSSFNTRFLRPDTNGRYLDMAGGLCIYHDMGIRHCLRGS